MKKIILSLSLLGLSFVNAPVAFSADTFFVDNSSEDNKQSVWQDIKPSEVEKQYKQKVSNQKLSNFRQLSLNEELLRDQLQDQSSKDSSSSARSDSSNSKSVITIPLPDGVSIRVSLEKTQVMSPDLAAKYPKIKTWKATGIDDKAVTGRVDFTHYGFHAMLIMADGDTVFVERETPDSEGIYKSFSKRSNTESFNQGFQCSSKDHHDSDGIEVEKQALGKAASDLLTYRLAVAATGEYTQFHGGINNAVSAIVTTINRVNQINERDLAVTFELIDTVVYTNAATDPYTNGDSTAMLEENALNLTNRLGSSGFDIGHVFTQGASAGLALLGSVCDDTTFTGAKAGGMTGSPNPVGDAFDVDFVAHELGHQLGASHTFNSETLSCGGDNRTKNTAVEPGSGSTIMGYAGICGSNDLQAHSDAAYHVASISQIFTYTRVSRGNTCGSSSAVSNNEPEPSAGVDTAIPANTPFVLVGSATDADSSDLLGYSWEQTDVGTASNVDIDTGDNAIIRSWFPTTSAKRYIPRLQDLFDDRRVRGEKLPVADRNLEFTLTVRDGRGGFDWDEMNVTVSGASPFQLTSHNSAQNLEVGQNTTVRWSVGGTSSSPINCNSVDISLLQANGNEQTLKQQTANDGVESVVIPGSALGTSLARFMVKCNGNKSTFFNISAGDILVVAGTGGSSDGGGSLDKFMLLLLLLAFVPLVQRRRLQQKIVSVKIKKGEEE